jgi:tripartite-type tricarboxylate transporter receptor subunit TctC
LPLWSIGRLVIAAAGAQRNAPICPGFRRWQGPGDAVLSGEHQGSKKMPTKIDRRHFITAGSAAASLPLLSRRASAQAAWPSRNIRMVCSYPAGGQTDLLARAFGDFISRQVGKTVVIENKAGASGAIGAQEVARAEPDGHTILCSISTTYTMNRVMIKNPGYDMDRDLTLVSIIPGAGLLLVANPKHGIKSLDDFVAFARKSDKVNFGTYSAGSSPHMTINELNKQYGLKIEPVHYRGEAPMWTGLAEGSLDVAMGSYTAAQSVLQSNHGVVFAVHSKKVDAIPDIKTLPEQGATSKFFTVSGFTGWALPKATPQPIVDRLSELFVAANNDPKVKEVLATFVLEPAIGFKESNALYQRELPVWLETAKSLGIEPA